jgi:S-adenosylmethionine:tRNA ribosyltransferase-isomerase
MHLPSDALGGSREAVDVNLFDFDLPENRIALRPAEPRDAARLLTVRPGEPEPLADRHISGLPNLLRPGDCLVFNNTRVLPAQLHGQRVGPNGVSARIGITLHKRLGEMEWRAFARPAKRLAVGDRIVFADNFSAIVTDKGETGEIGLQFACPPGSSFEACLAAHGIMPLPPYIAARRAPDARDAVDYQTIYSRHNGAVAAPTAGLHFTEALLARLGALGVGTAFLTLHVGAGTFLPVKADDTDDHRMHAEWGEIGTDVAARLNAVRAGGGRVVAVGTTALRLLESAADDDGTLRPFSGDTDIFITPGYRFKAVDLLMTNFHLPRSTLFMLVSAFSGLETMKRAYSHAIAAGYRFYSYGDASLLWPAEDSLARQARP